jgi:hypothetical protein
MALLFIREYGVGGLLVKRGNNFTLSRMQLVGFSYFLWKKMGLLTRVADPDPHESALFMEAGS